MELLVTMAVISILAMMAAPTFGRMLASGRITTATNELVTALRQARGEAARTGAAVAVLGKSGTAGNFTAGWRVFPDTAGDGTYTDDTVMIRDTDALGTVSVSRVDSAYATVSDSLLVFNSRGGTTASFFKVCSSSSTAIPGRIVQVSAVGRVSVLAAGVSCA